MIQKKTISLVTRTMGRLSFLEKSLPTWVKVNEVDSIIIVDWGMTENTVPLLALDGRISLLRVDGQKYFEGGASRNIGVRFADSDYIFMVDCDVSIIQNPFSLPIEDKNFIVFKIDKYEAGTCIFSKKMWLEINGFLENLLGWGDQDVDFYKKAEALGYKKIVAPDFVTHQEHTNDSRMKNYHFKGSLMESRDKNRKIIKNAIEQVQKKYQCQIINNKECFETIL
jgi:N-terminal domain of galactosyltransferase